MWKELGLSGVALLLFARIYGFCKSGGTYFESRKKAADYLNVSERAIIKAINALQDKGLVVEIGTHALKSGRRTKVFAIPGMTPRGEPTGPNCHSGSELCGEASLSPEQSSSEKGSSDESHVATGVNKVHPTKASNNKGIDREGLEDRFAKYDD